MTRKAFVPILIACTAACGGRHGGAADSGPDAADTAEEGADTPEDVPVDTAAETDAPPVEHPNDGSPIGTNLNGVSDWSTEWAFVDAFRMSREWISGSSSEWDDGRAIDVDEHGWVRSLQTDQIARTLVFWDIPDRYPSGRYIVLYEGEGTIEYWNAGAKNETLSAPGRDVVDVDPSAGGVGINITSVNPSNHLRDIRFIHPGGVCEDDMFAYCEDDSDCAGSCSLFEDNHATQIFHPIFLDRIKTYSLIRFMDWMSTNGSPLAGWDARPRVDDARWTTDLGVPVEIMVDLANRLHAHPWFTMPHLATDDFVREFAAVVRDGLDPTLSPHVEYSNEVWNGIFEQSGYAREQGLALDLSTDEYQAQLFFYSRRAVEIFELWEEVHGSPVSVMATQAANPWVSEQVLGFEDASLSTDALAVAPYFGGYLGSPSEESRVEAMTLDDLLAELESVALPEAVAWMEDQQAVADDFGVPMIAYEGGQHLAGNGGVEGNDTINALFDEANRDARMGAIYATYLAAWRDAGGRVFAHFVNCGGYSRWGRWGALEHVTQPRDDAPKYDALMTFIEENPAWW